MGNHTWCANRIEKDTLDFNEMKSKIISHNKKIISYWSDGKYKTDEEYSNSDRQSINSEMEKANKTIMLIQKNILNKKRKLLKLYSECDDKLFVYKEELYCDNDDYHDLFRTDFDEESHLTSLDETMQYLMDNICVGNTYFSETDNKIITDIIDVNRIKSFWENNPGGIIYFG